jgi:hypothetical protein
MTDNKCNGWLVLNNLFQGFFWLCFIVFAVYACSDKLPRLDNDCQCVESEKTE